MTAPTLDPVSDPYADQGDQTNFVVRAYDKHLTYLGIVGGYESITCTKRHNAISTAELVLRADHPRVPDLLADGARLAISYGPFADHHQLMAGRLESRGASANAGTPVMTFNLVDDFQFLGMMLGWPHPSLDIDEQGATTAYWADAGLASNVAQNFIWHAKERLGLNLSVYPDPVNYYADLGSWIKIRSRMDTMADVLVAKLDRAGVGINLGGYGTEGQIYVRFSVGLVRDKVLDADSGALVDWSWTQAEPTVTRVVIGGAGEGTSREYRQYVDEGREERLGTIKEVFVDARDIGAEYEDAIKDVPLKLKEQEQALKAADVQRLIRQKSYVALQQAITSRDDAVWRRDQATNPSAEYTEAVASAIQWEDNVDAAQETYDEDNTEYTNRTNELSAAHAAYLAAIDLRDELKVSTDEEFAEKAADVFHEFSTQYGLSLTLAETPTFRYGKTFVVGDTVTVALPGSTTITDVVREVTISDSVESGVTVAPVVGTQETMSNPNRLLVSAVSRLKRTARMLSTSR